MSTLEVEVEVGGDVEVDASAFEMTPPGYDGRVSALCLHGFTGTPYEMRPIAEELARRGIRCVGPVMAGHGSTASQLAKTSYAEWIDLARAALGKLRADSEQVFVAGMSMGGVVTLALAAENLADAVAVMGTPLRLPLAIRLAVPLAKYIAPFRKKKPGETDIREPNARDRHPALDAIPLAGVHELIKMQSVVRRALPKIIAPIFVAHGALDRTSNPLDARTIFSEVNASERALHICERSGHVVTVDHDGPALAIALADFLERQKK